MAKKGSAHHEQAVRESAALKREITKAKPAPAKHVVHNDAPSKPQTHRADAAKPGATDYVTKMHPGAKPGDWQGKFVPKPTAAQKKAQAFLVKKGVTGGW